MNLETAVRAAAGGDLDAFAEITRRFQHMAFGYALSFVRDLGQAEDIVQDVFLALMRDLERYDASRAGLRTYLFGIARNLARYKARSVRRLTSLDHAEFAAAFEDPLASLSANQERRRLRRWRIGCSNVQG